MVEEAEEIITAGKEQTPVDTGSLKNSGKALPPEITHDNVRVELGFGGPSKPHDVHYAIYVHEDMDAHHPVGNAKYLEIPFFEHLPEFQRRLGAEIGHGFRRTVRRGR
jgi:hypothetical protein